jgi:hypothetical protein
MNQMVNRGKTAAVGGFAQMGRCTRQRMRAVYSRGRWLPPRWSARLGGMTTAIREEPGQPTITELTGPLPDQAARLGVLNQRYLHRVPTPERGVSFRVRRRRMPLPSACGGVPTRDATCCGGRTL